MAGLPTDTSRFTLRSSRAIWAGRALGGAGRLGADGGRCGKARDPRADDSSQPAAWSAGQTIILSSAWRHSGGDREYEVLRVSIFDEDIDGPKTFVQTSSSSFEDKTALYCHLTRDIGLIRVITTKGQLWFIMEPGTEVLGWITAVEEMTLPIPDHASDLSKTRLAVAQGAEIA